MYSCITKSLGEFLSQQDQRICGIYSQTYTGLGSSHYESGKMFELSCAKLGHLPSTFGKGSREKIKLLIVGAWTTLFISEVWYHTQHIDVDDK